MPKIDIRVGDGILEDRIKGAVDAKKSRLENNKVDYKGFATFLGHLLDWGINMLMNETFSIQELVFYTFLIIKIAEDHGGVRTAYYYDLITRIDMAKALEAERDELHPFLTIMDMDRLKLAKDKVEIVFEINRPYWTEAEKSFHR